MEREWAEKGKLIQIQHARTTAGEKVITCEGLNKLLNYKVDGSFEYEGVKYVCEYNGCNFHGCKKCFPHSRDTCMDKKISIEQRWKNTKLKERRLKEKGYIVPSKWSCEFTEEKKNDKIRDFVNSLNIQNRDGRILN